MALPRAASIGTATKSTGHDMACAVSRASFRHSSDVDISETPFTNTLPIRRLGLAPGESADNCVVYFDGNELQPWPEPQRYTCLERNAQGGLYRFLSLDGGFTADLSVDADGLVVDYPGLFKRTLS
jgi:hypothetical protein